MSHSKARYEEIRHVSRSIGGHCPLCLLLLIVLSIVGMQEVLVMKKQCHNYQTDDIEELQDGGERKSVDEVCAFSVQNIYSICA